MPGERPRSARSVRLAEPPRTPRRGAGRPASSSDERGASRRFVVPEQRRRRNPNKTPGPGTYDVAGLSKFTGGSSPRSPGWGFGTAPRSISCARASRALPGPGAYDVRGTSRWDGGSEKRWTPNSFSFPGQHNRPSPLKDQRSPGPIYYYPDCEHDSDHTTTPKYSIDRTPHASLSNKAIGPGPAYNLRDGKVGSKVLAIGDVTHKTAQWATCASRLRTAAEGTDTGPGPGTYDAVDLNKCSKNSEQAPAYTIRPWVPYENLPTRPVPKGQTAPKVVRRDPGIGPKYNVAAGAGGVLPNKANPRAFTFGKDERFWAED